VSSGIPDTLKDLTEPIDSLTPYYKNPRRRDDLEDLRESLRVNGQYRPIIVNTGTKTGRPREILAGNHTWQAAFDEGWPQIAVTWVDVNDAEAARIVAVDNRSNDQAWYDEPELLDLLGMIATDDVGLAGSGFTTADFSDLEAKLTPPDLDALADEFGDPEAADTWPTLRIQVPRPLFNRAMAALDSYEGEPHERLAQLLDDAAP
jgi:ParB-like chromosome segregation protein Spo0J